jgi:hypothetical protein
LGLSSQYAANQNKVDPATQTMKLMQKYGQAAPLPEAKLQRWDPKELAGDTVIAAASLPAEVEVTPAPSPLVLMDTEYRDANGLSYFEANVVCKSAGKRICKQEEYCKDGAPVMGSTSGDHWAPIDVFNDWVQVGDTKDNPMVRQCQTHKQSFGGKPGWGQLQKQADIDQKLLCCPNTEEDGGGFQPLAPVATWTNSADAGALSDEALSVYERIVYWTKPTPIMTPEQLNEETGVSSPLEKLFPHEQGKYILFDVDHGGFNNIRLGELISCFVGCF